MIDVDLNCAMCGKHRKIDDLVCDSITDMADIITDAGWFWQDNGDNFDIYCSKECLK